MTAATKKVRTDIGDVAVKVPRDRSLTFEPVTVPVGQGRVSGLDQMVISHDAEGLTTGDIAVHLDCAYDQRVDRPTISRIADAFVADMGAWRSRPLDAIDPVLFVDGTRIKIRDGTVSDRAVSVAVGVNARGSAAPTGRTTRAGRDHG